MGMLYGYCYHKSNNCGGINQGGFPGLYTLHLAQAQSTKSPDVSLSAAQLQAGNIDPEGK
jgi:hypothetical protein